MVANPAGESQRGFTVVPSVSGRLFTATASWYSSTQALIKKGCSMLDRERAATTLKSYLEVRCAPALSNKSDGYIKLEKDFDARRPRSAIQYYPTVETAALEAGKAACYAGFRQGRHHPLHADTWKDSATVMADFQIRECADAYVADFVPLEEVSTNDTLYAEIVFALETRFHKQFMTDHLVGYLGANDLTDMGIWAAGLVW